MKVKVISKGSVSSDVYVHLKVGQGHYRGDDEWPMPVLEALQYEMSYDDELEPFNTNKFSVTV